MRRLVWENKSNGQLCITIPKDSDINQGDIVEVKKSKIKEITYNGVVGDLFHYGHLYSLNFAKSISDYNVCGVLTDKAVESYRNKPIANLKERKSIFLSLKSVDRVMIQDNIDPTENLKKLHKEFPDAKIKLVYGSNWKNVPGSEYVKSVGGEIIQHPYYEKLSTFKIINKLIENKENFKDIKRFTSLIGESQKEDFYESKGNKTIVFSKANTLNKLKLLLKNSIVEDLFIFTITDWRNNKNNVLESIKNKFGHNQIVVRSSATQEDGIDKSMAGCFESILNVNSSDFKEIENAIKKVVDSYKNKMAESSFNQILVQKQTTDIIMSGVVFTRTLEKNAPYYVINYDNTTRDTSSVTSGREHKMLIISHFVKFYPDEFISLMKSIKEIESIIPQIPLDIEFAVKENGQVVIFQVRPLSVNLQSECNDEEIYNTVNLLKEKFNSLNIKKEHLSGNFTFFADMPDWNPAEIIGDNPNHLDFSLYNYIITGNIWHEARTSQGYYNVNPAKLVELFGNKPYVNVRHTFNSFTPASLSHGLREKLINFYLEKLKGNLELHDKVEFDVLYTIYDLTFDQRSRELLNAGFSLEEISEFKKALIELTNNLVNIESIDYDMFIVKSMNQEICGDSSIDKIKRAKILLDECKKKGTLQFSRLARLGFVAKILLHSLVKRCIINQKLSDDILESVQTVATKLSDDLKNINNLVSKEEFINTYGHLRPGTYDITSMRYDQQPQLLDNVTNSSDVLKKKLLTLNQEELNKITNVFKEEGLNFDGDYFFKFLKKAIEAREESKFEFTKGLSNAIELIALAGEQLGFTRQELAMLDVSEIFANYNDTDNLILNWKRSIANRQQERTLNENIILPSILIDKEDFDIIKQHAAKPNFVTQKKVEASIVNVDKIDGYIPNLRGKIVLIENGDPGYDWIFTRDIAALITKYGGVASHMSIRCAEFGIPAAIGCGEIFNQVREIKKATLDCEKKKIFW
jgi:glutamine kinase